jgi:phosphoribosylaminoimidazole-succinocarboxamide synthase
MSTLDNLLVASGKVREIYDLGDDTLLLVASDRMSAFDVILPTPIPDKGRVLTGMTRFWLDRTSHIVANHMLGTAPSELPELARTPELAGRSMHVKKLQMMPIECVVRGYLVGSGWKDYQRTGTVCGHSLPAGLEQAARLPRTLFTPSTKAELGDHDENITETQGIALVGGPRYRELERASIALYEVAAKHAATRGIILADTKFEFGVDSTGTLHLADEVLTPDSSRYWPADSYHTGMSPPSFDKQYVRDYLETLDWDKTAPGPELPDDVRDGTAARYRDAYNRITGADFGAYLQEMGVTA